MIASTIALVALVAVLTFLIGHLLTARRHGWHDRDDDL